ncbi:SpoU rRNA methylases [Rhabdaerophilaceae bacterium]
MAKPPTGPRPSSGKRPYVPEPRGHHSERPPASGDMPARPVASRAFEQITSQPRSEAPPRFKDKARFAPKPKPPKVPLPEDTDVLYGIHSVREALANPARRFRKLLATENAMLRLSEGIDLRIEPILVKPDEINKLLEPDAVHQGAYLEAQRLPLLALGTIPQDRIVVALDQVTDPHNVGAILRSSAAFGVGAVLTTFRHSPEITGVLAKAASGALEHVPIVGVTNLGRALNELKAGGFQVVGLDSEAPEIIGAVTLRRPVVLVLGAEGKGLRQSTRALCDVLARLELPGAIKSLNVSNAAAIGLYAVYTALESTS